MVDRPASQAAISLEEIAHIERLAPAGYRALVEVILEQLHAQFPGAQIYTTQFDSVHNVQRVIATKGEPGEGMISAETIPLDESFCVRMADGRGPRHVRDVATEPIYSALVPDGTVGSYAGSPIAFSDGTLVGSLCALTNDLDLLTEESVALMQVLAQTLGRALEMEQEVEQLRAANVALTVAASTDPLTGVANRRIFGEALEQSWKLARRESMSSFVLVADLDRFKLLNDTRGHAIGDLALVELAQALETQARETDIVGRLGGDEFAVVLHGCRDGVEAGTYATRARLDYHDRMRSAGIEAGFSCGFASLGATDSPAEALEVADRAMYDDKSISRA